MQTDRFTCEQTVQRLDNYLDRELTEQEMRPVEAPPDRRAGSPGC